MDNIPLKHCGGCDKDFPATEEHFYPSYLKPGGRDQCKNCHNQTARHNPYITRRAKLLAIAQPIQEDELSTYQPLAGVAKATGDDQARIEADILDAQLPVFKFLYHNMGMSLAIRREDAERYIATASNGRRQKVESTLMKLPVGSFDQCGSCGATTGNIAGDMNEKTRKMYGYLCTKCYRLVHDSGANPKRIRSVLTYLELTRPS